MDNLKIYALLVLLVISCKEQPTKETETPIKMTKDSLIIIEENYRNIAIKCGLGKVITIEQAKEEKTKIVQQIKESLSEIKSQNWKYEIKEDSIRMAEKITIYGKVEYNYSRVPIKRIWNVGLDKNKITLYTKGKYIPENRFNYHPLKTSQKNIISDLSKEKTRKLYMQLIMISKINCFLNNQ